MRAVRRPLRRLALLATSAAVAAGCGGDDGGGGGPVTLQVAGSADEIAVYREVVEAYRHQTGDEVRLVEVPDRDAHLAKLTTAFSAGKPPDVFLLNYRNYGPFVARNVIDPAGPRLEASEHLRRADFYPSPLQAFTTGGVLQCMPQNASSLVVYVNRDFFSAAGVEVPTGPWSFEELFRAALELRGEARRRRPSGSSHALGVDPELVRLAPFIWAAGGELVDDEARPTRFTFDTPAARRGIDRFLSLYREGLVPTEKAVESQGLEERFAEGRLAMFMSSRREVPTFRQIDGFEWDVAAFPRAERAAGILHSDAYCLARGPGADAAWRFVEFAAGPVGQRLLAQGGRTVPSLRAIARSRDFLRRDAPPRNAQVFLDAIEDLRRLPNSPNWPRIEDSATLAFRRAFYAEMTVEQAIARVEAETSGLF